MPTTYAAYSNLIAANGHNPAMASAASSTPTSQRNSVSSETSVEVPKKSRWHRFLDELKPLDEPVANPVGFFSPIPPYPPRQQKKSSTSSAKAEDTPSRRASKAFEHFRNVAMERHSPRARA